MSETEVPVSVLYNYTAADEDELTVKKDDVLLVLAMYDDGWWLIKRGTNTGLVPANYLELIDTRTEKSSVTDKDRQRMEKKSPRRAHGATQAGRKDDKKSSDLIELKHLREEAEEKINALRYDFKIPFNQLSLLPNYIYLRTAWPFKRKTKKET